MRLVTGNIVSRHEFFISVIILSCLFIIAAAILVKQARYDVTLFGVVTASGKDENITQKSDKVQNELPAPENFKPLLTVEKYNPSNLYEKIDGKATLYLESGFKEMSSQRFVSVKDGSLWFELFIYDMGEFKNAYSVYGQQKREDAEEIPDLTTSYRTSNAAFMVHGNYYIELLGSTRSRLLTEALLDMCKKIKTDLKPSGKQYESSVSLTDKRYIIPGSDKLNLHSAFGYSAFRNVYTARYIVKDMTATVFMSEMKNPEEARKMAEGYYMFLMENGGELKKEENKSGVRYVSLYGSTEVIFSCGKYVAGIHEADTLEIAGNILNILFEKICNRK